MVPVRLLPLTFPPSTILNPSYLPPTPPSSKYESATPLSSTSIPPRYSNHDITTLAPNQTAFPKYMHQCIRNAQINHHLPLTTSPPSSSYGYVETPSNLSPRIVFLNGPDTYPRLNRRQKYGEVLMYIHCHPQLDTLVHHDTRSSIHRRQYVPRHQ